MVKLRFLPLVVSALAIAVSIATACAPDEEAGAGFVADSGPDLVTVPDVSKDDGPPDVAEEDSCTLACSDDLHTIIGCDGQVVETCPGDKACLGGACVDACKAADANPSIGGCEYYASVPAQWPVMVGQCYAVVIANTWTADVTMSVEYQGKPLDITSLARIPTGRGTSMTYEPLPSGKLPAGQIAILFLAAYGDGSGSQCPEGTAPAITDRVVERLGTGYTDAFRISADRPVTAYDFYPYGGAPFGNAAASLLFPTSVWATNYVAQTPYPRSVVVGPARSSFIQLVAKEDATTIEIQPSEDIEGSVDGADPSVTSCQKGQVQTYTLNKGQVLQFVQRTELVGSIISSTKPVGLWGGASVLSIEPDQPDGDWAHQQVPPINMLGHEYVAVRYRNRVDLQNENTPWRLVGAVDGTTLSYDPKKPINAPLFLDARQVATFKFADGEEPFPFVVRSQDADHPFYLWSYMTSNSNANGRGDAEWVVVAPMQQYANSYLFLTDPTFPETNLVVVRAKADGTFKDVTLDCAGALEGWMPIDSAGRIQYTRLDLVRHDYEPQGGCDNGTHLMKSDAPFGLTVWGWGAITNRYSSSYGFVPRMAAQPTNDVIVPIIK